MRYINISGAKIAVLAAIIGLVNIAVPHVSSAADVCTDPPTTQGTATATTNVTTAGTYRAWSRIMVPDTTNNSYYLKVGSSCHMNIGDAASIVPNTWVWVDYKDGATATKSEVTLAVGSNTLVLTGKDPGVRVDRVIFSDDGCIPTGTGDNCSSATNDIAGPTVNISAPSPSGTTVSGFAVPVSASALDNVGVAGVQFKLDGINLGAEDTSAPYSIAWDSTAAAEGTHSLTAVARDGAGNTTTSAAVSVIVSNAITKLNPAHDTRLRSDNPTGVYGLADQLEADGTLAESILKFDVPAGSGSISSAKLRLHANSDTNGPLAFYSVSNNLKGTTTPWVEDGLNRVTWNNKPDRGALVARKEGPIARTQFHEFDVTCAIIGAGTFSFSMVQAPNTGDTVDQIWTGSEENTTGGKPELVIVRGASNPNCSETDTTAPTVSNPVVTLNSASATSVSLSWTAASDNVAVTKYYVQRKLKADPDTAYAIVGQPTATNYADNTVAANTQYTYRVQATDAADNLTNYTPLDVPTPPPPPDTTPPTVKIDTPAHNALVFGTITATATPADNVAVAGVQFKVDGSLAGTEDTTAPYNFTLDTLTLPNGSHTITAIARDTSGNLSQVPASPAAGTSFIAVTVNNPDTTAPTAPTNLRLNGTATATSVPLAWDASTDNVGVVKYNILRNGAVIGTSTSLTYTDNTAVASTTYSYQVQAVDEATNTSPSSEPPLSVTTPAAPDTTPPSAPTNLTATATSSTQINLTWTASTDTGGSGLAGYNVYRNGSATPLNATPITTATSYGDAAGLAASTSYSYTVEAIDGAGNKSPLTAAVSATTQAGPIALAPILPADDAWVNSQKTNRTYGTTSQIKVDSSPDQDSLLKFTVTGIGTKQVKSAKLRLYAFNGSNKGGSVYKLLSNTWSESTVTWNTRPPAATTAITTLGPVTTGSYIDIDLSSLITSDGTYGIKIDGISADDAVYNAKEASTGKPQLILTVE